MRRWLPTAVISCLFVLATAFAAEAPMEVGNDALQSLLMQADRVVVTRDWAEESTVLFSSSKFEDLSSFRQAAMVDVSGGQFYCACFGSPIVRLYQQNEELLVISNHHGRSIRNSRWPNNVLLKDAGAWVAWFDEHGMPEPRQELENSIQRAKDSEANEARWLQAMPPAVVPLWSQRVWNSVTLDLAPFREALDAAYPDPYVRILALLEWYGSGAGPWSGYPAYESHVEKLLLDYSTAELLTAVESQPLTPQQVEGAARLFGGWTFNKRRPKDVALVPPSLKATLLEHSLQSDDEDKRSRAIAAFQR